MDSTGGLPGLINKSGLQTMMGAMLAALGFEQAADTSYLGAPNRTRVNESQSE